MPIRGVTSTPGSEYSFMSTSTLVMAEFEYNTLLKVEYGYIDMFMSTSTYCII